MADLLLGLGAAVVKVACKVWLKDDAFAANASVEVVDIVRAKVSGELDQRSARRLFEDLEVPVAKKLGVLRQHEFAGMPDNEWSAGVLAVGDTLRRARFTDADIFAGDLDPLYLRRQIATGARGATRDLSEAGTALYDRLLTECCAYVVELTSTLPRFSVGAFAEILRRESVILQRVNEVLDRMPSPDAVRAGAARAEEDFAAAYRRQVVNRLDRLELFGVTVSESVRGYPLSTAYVSLSVASEKFQAPEASFRKVFGDDFKPATPRIEDVLAETSRLFLRGGAGSGKTTLLQRLAVRAARRDLPDWRTSMNTSPKRSERLSRSTETVPFLIRLRQYVGKDLPGPEGFLGQVGQHIADNMPRGWVHGLLREGRALVLVDGVDELPDAQRRSARDWLADLVNSFPESYYVVTSRPAAASDRWLEEEGFDAAEVQPMTWPDVREFVRHWHAAFRDTASDEEQRAHLLSCEQALLETLYGRRHLRMLATSPLLCALICALNLDRRMQLPQDRMELYAVALDMLLERRDSERQIPMAGVSLSKTDKTSLLEDLAYWLIRNGQSDATKDRMVERLTHRLRSMPRIQGDPPAVLDGLLERSGLIREPVADRIDFVHRTFEEYLAAHAAVNEDQIGELVRNAHDDQWREVVVMAAGHAQPRQRDELLRGLLTRSSDEPKNRQVLQTLAVACLETSPQLDPALYDQIQDVAESLMPPRTFRQAEILARIGEPLLDLLAERPPRGARQAAATIRAASLVGGDAALRVIATCSRVAGRSVRDEVGRAWPLFDAKEYAETVLSDSIHGEMVQIDDPALLTALRGIHVLRWLSIRFPAGHGDLTVIRDLPRLQGLNVIEDIKLCNLGPLTGHPRLEQILLQNHCPLDLSPLASIPQLRALQFRPAKVTGLKALDACTNLDEIALISPPLVPSLGQFIPQRALKSLQVIGSDLENLSPLFGIPQLGELSKLRLMGCPSLHSIEGIEQWASTLRSFTLWDASFVSDLAPLTALHGLISLDLGWWDESIELSFVRGLTSLSHLIVRSDKPVDLTPLRGMTQLTVHGLRGQHVYGAELLGEGSKVVRL
jgi:hypothetical protein